MIAYLMVVYLMIIGSFVCSILKIKVWIKPGHYLDIALVAGKYKIYSPALAIDLPTQSGIHVHTNILMYIHMYICVYIFLHN